MLLIFRIHLSHLTIMVGKYLILGPHFANLVSFFINTSSKSIVDLSKYDYGRNYFSYY